MAGTKHVLKITNKYILKIIVRTISHLCDGVVVVDTPAVLHGNNGHICLVQNAGSNHIPVASLSPANDSAIDILGQGLIGTWQTGITDPAG